MWPRICLPLHPAINPVGIVSGLGQQENPSYCVGSGQPGASTFAYLDSSRADDKMFRGLRHKEGIMDYVLAEIELTFVVSGKFCE